MKKIIYKDMNEILEMLDDKNFDRLWKKYAKNFDVLCFDREDKAYNLSIIMLDNYLLKLLDQDNECIKFFDMVGSSNYDDILNFIKNDFVFEINGDYYIPLECKLDISDDEVLDNCEELLVQYYLFINGAIELNELVLLIKKSGVKTTKKSVRDICNHLNFEVENNIVYFNDFAKVVNTNNLLINIKKEHEYYVADFENIYEHFDSLLDMGELNDIDKYLGNIKDDETINRIKVDLFMLVLFNNNLPLMIKEYFKTESISKKQLNGITKYLCDLAKDTPCWILNGYTHNEVDYIINEEVLNKSFIEPVDFDEIIQCIFDYVMINGVIKVDKIYDLMLNVHKYNTNKKEIDKRINILVKEKNILKSEDLLVIVPGTKQSFQEFYKNKHIEEYKIIDDLKSVELNNLELHLKVEQLCDKYKFNDRLEQIILFFTQVDVFSIEKFEEILSAEKIIIPQSIKNKVIPEIKKINKGARLWAYNGFTIEEVKNKKIPLKQK